MVARFGDYRCVDDFSLAPRRLRGPARHSAPRPETPMYFRVAADALLLLHLAFILFAVFGGAFAARWRWTPALHLPAVAWAVFVELSGRICPLTYLENSLRRSAGQSGYAGDFVQHYLLVLIYPAGLTREIQFALAAAVAAINIVIYVWVVLRWRDRAGRV